MITMPVRAAARALEIKPQQQNSLHPKKVREANGLIAGIEARVNVIGRLGKAGLVKPVDPMQLVLITRGRRDGPELRARETLRELRKIGVPPGRIAGVERVRPGR
jgi:hypothetical protein